MASNLKLVSVTAVLVKNSMSLVGEATLSSLLNKLQRKERPKVKEIATLAFKNAFQESSLLPGICR